MTEPRHDEKAGWCGNCRGGTHGLCASLKCTCRRQHPLRPRAPRPLNTHPKEPTMPEPALKAVPSATSGLVWEEPPPKRNGGRGAEARFADELHHLKTRPGQWAKIGTFVGKSSASSAVKRLQKTTTGYEFVARNSGAAGSSLYGRWLDLPQAG